MNAASVKRFSLRAALLVACAAHGCAPPTEADKLTDEISAASGEGGRLIVQGAESWTAAGFKFAEGKREEGERLLLEAADLYERTIEPLGRAADASERAGRLDLPDWHKRYFTLRARHYRNLIEASKISREEILLSLSGRPDEDQARRRRKDEVTKTHRELLEEIARIEVAHDLPRFR